MAKKKPRRRRRGEGSIAQRTDGSWVGYVLSGQIVGNRQKRRYASGATYEEVRRKLAKLQSSADAGTLTDISEITVKQHLEHWLENSVKGTVRRVSFNNYSSLVNTHIIPAIGGIKVRSVSEMTVQSLVNSIAEKVSPAAAGKCLRLLKRSLKKLVPKVLPANPCADVEKPRVRRAKIRPLDRDQAEKLMNAFQSERMGALYVVAVLSGARMGELLALSWRDVDFEAGAISINKTLSNTGRQTEIEEPKSEASRRRILLPARAMESLIDHRRKMLIEGNAKAGTVFCKRDGSIMDRTALHREFTSILRKTDLPKIRFHDLRHTHATLLLLAGENPKIVSERLGHSKIGMTLDIYSHVLPSMQEQAKAKLDAMFKKPG